MSRDAGNCFHLLPNSNVKVIKAKFPIQAGSQAKSGIWTQWHDRRGGISFTAAQARNLHHLFQITADHRREGQKLQKEISDFEAEFWVAVENIWARPVTDVDAEVPALDT
ncbi:hypothetical protein K443DRAFT_683303 [Laccaria amethystina LaAM-08-1]|uniref:Uncharacterized protein n=1 Tax=Laccaria amethystina LaAM-08-1 TaxID=1095629 RepID=A0A0C9XG65_9AGAR|nr:hypothetical protein K443DRAFT_683303 [Laccaria amethystina LaAM-08-1]